MLALVIAYTTQEVLVASALAASSVATALRRTSTPILLSASVVVTTATLVFLNTHVVEKCSHLINHLNMHASYGVSTIHSAVYFAARGLGQYSPLPKKHHTTSARQFYGNWVFHLQLI